MRKIVLTSVALTALFVLFIELMTDIQDFQLEKNRRLEVLTNEVSQFNKTLLIDRERNRRINLTATIAKRHNPLIGDSVIVELVDMSYRHQLPIELICATITHESAATWNPEVESHAGAIGLMQIMPTTGIYLADLENITWTNAEEVLTNPIYNIRMGCRYLSIMVGYYGIDGGLAAYNGGEWRARKYYKSKDPLDLKEETRKYIPAILSLFSQYGNI